LATLLNDGVFQRFVGVLSLLRSPVNVIQAGGFEMALRPTRGQLSERNIACYLRLEKMIKRRVNLKIISASRETIRFAGQSLTAHCAACDREVEAISAYDAIRILRVDEAALGRLIAAGRVHAIATVSGQKWICRNSLFAPGRNRG
jgi:hypothetical protein